MEVTQTVTLGYAQLWLFFTAVTFTMVGFFWGASIKTDKAAAHVIDTLIKEGYLRTRGSGDQMKILKYWEEERDENIQE